MNSQELEEEFTRNIYTSRDLRLAHPKFLEIWPHLKEDYGCDTGLALEISCTYRSIQAQKDAYAIGRTKPGKKITDCDGFKNLSKHNVFPARAIDVYAHLAGKMVALWDIETFSHLEKLAQKYGLIWGGNFKGIVDRPHLELLDSVK